MEQADDAVMSDTQPQEEKSAFVSVLVQSSPDENRVQRLPSGRKKRIAAKSLLVDKYQDQESSLTGGSRSLCF